MFQQTICRQPTADELTRFSNFLKQCMDALGNQAGVPRGLAAVLLHPEAVYRLELGQGPGDVHGRVRLAPLELAHALAYALSDKRPDALLLQAAQEGKLGAPEDVRREATRLLADGETSKARILRFFREYFGYTGAPAVFKDEATIKAAGFVKYFPGRLVDDTDLLVMHVLEADRQVLRELLTTSKSFIHSPTERRPVGKDDAPPAAIRRQMKPNGLAFPRDNPFHKHYNFDPVKWSQDQPLQLSPDQRLGILTQPSWLIAHSDNSDNHAIHRGKWIREQLLGGYIPDTPITVDAQLPDEPQATLRQRMRVTREAYCWKCHEKMDPLGLPFEMFDHFGQHRTQEQGKPVDASGAVVDSGDPRLDGKVADALELIRKLADSERAEQSSFATPSATGWDETRRWTTPPRSRRPTATIGPATAA